jgi:hypothetical protein
MCGRAKESKHSELQISCFDCECEYYSFITENSAGDRWQNSGNVKRRVFQLPNEKRLALIAKLNRKVPIIVRQCLNNPVSRYMRFLPEDIRKML